MLLKHRKAIKATVCRLGKNKAINAIVFGKKRYLVPAFFCMTGVISVTIMLSVTYIFKDSLIKNPKVEDTDSAKSSIALVPIYRPNSANCKDKIYISNKFYDCNGLYRTGDDISVS